MSRWRVLDLEVKGAPPLLVKSTFSTSGYYIELTDLSRIWAQDLPKYGIIRCAVELGSSIDPGEDDEQLRIFLGKIESALNREDGTSLSLRRGGGDESLSLHVSAPLPRPLAPFSWAVNLHGLPAHLVQSELVTPLIQQAGTLHHQIRSLISELHEKDRVISKITDRLETSGNDLTTVFPGVSNVKTSRKKSQREQLAKHVKGLSDFDEAAWKAVQGREGTVKGELGLENGMINEVLRDLPRRRTHGGKIDGRPWWELLDDGASTRADSHLSQTDSVHHDFNAQQSVTNGITVEKDESMRDDEFQRQGTPPHLKRHAAELRDEPHSQEPVSLTSEEVKDRTKFTNETHDESTTEDEDDDLDATMHKSPPIRSTPNPPFPSTPPKTLGVIGGRSLRPSPSPAKKEREAEADVLESKPRTTLGTFGGKAKASVVPAATAKREQPASRPSSPPGSSKLGMLGGSKSSGPSPDILAAVATETLEPAMEMSQRQSRAPAKEETPAPCQTSEERADRKRDQLKRELEEKAKAPVKKKRKF